MDHTGTPTGYGRFRFSVTPAGGGSGVGSGGHACGGGGAEDRPGRYRRGAMRPPGLHRESKGRVANAKRGAWRDAIGCINAAAVMAMRPD